MDIHEFFSDEDSEEEMRARAGSDPGALKTAKSMKSMKSQITLENMDSSQTESPQTLLTLRNQMGKINNNSNESDSNSNDDSMMREMKENLKGSKPRKKHGTLDQRTRKKKLKSKEEIAEKLIGGSETSIKSSKKSRYVKM